MPGCKKRDSAASFVTLAVIFLLSAQPAQAAYLNLTMAGSSGTIGGAFFQQGEVLSGSGVFSSFVQLTGNNDVKQAYNTGVNNIYDNGSSPTFNHSIQVSDLRVLTINGVGYYSFLFDINENNNATDKYLSLDMLAVYTGTVQNPNIEPATPPIPPLGTVRYDMGAGNGILLNFDLESGSGRSDLEFLVPVANFAGALSTDYVYLFSKVGVLGVLAPGNPHGAPAGYYGNSDGFEEWSLGRTGSITVVPEPSTLLLAVSAAAGFGGFAGWRRRRCAK